MLCFPLFRPNSKNQQCFLSYGPLPNLKLLLFYGIATDGNPHDAVPLQLQVWLLTALGFCHQFSLLHGLHWSDLRSLMQSGIAAAAV